MVPLVRLSFVLRVFLSGFSGNKELARNGYYGFANASKAASHDQVGLVPLLFSSYLLSSRVRLVLFLKRHGRTSFTEDFALSTRATSRCSYGPFDIQRRLASCDS